MSAQMTSLAVIIPAAGIGKRMQSSRPKQYMNLGTTTVIEHTISRFLALPFVTRIVVVVAEYDQVFATLDCAKHDKVTTVIGGKERADSVLAGVQWVASQGFEWVMVHDAARPCVKPYDIENLFQTCITDQTAGILAVKVKDTMKHAIAGTKQIDKTVDREHLWHALTPQCAPVARLLEALEKQLDNGQVNSMVTDEASALELSGEKVNLIASSGMNIKITEPEDLLLATLYIESEQI